jgi:DNA invertase Pin-like site-specific DNA recombinase
MVYTIVDDDPDDRLTRELIATALREVADSICRDHFDGITQEPQITSRIRVSLRERQEGRRLFDMLRAGDTLVVRWVDRLGRNYADVTEVIRQFMARGVIIRTVINGLMSDGPTKDPMQKAVRDALMACMAATAEAQVEGTRERKRPASRTPRPRSRTVIGGGSRALTAASSA